MSAQHRPDDIRYIDGHTSFPQSDTRYVFTLSGKDLRNGWVRSAVGWNRHRCPSPKLQDVISEIFINRIPCIADREFITGGPDAVQNWNDLNKVFQQYTRNELGFFLIDNWFVNFNVENDYDWESNNKKDESVSDLSEEEPNDSTIKGPMDKFVLFPLKKKE